MSAVKCLNPDPSCEVRQTDGTCGASIIGYCEHQEIPPEEQAAAAQ
jgi:hypothetical protein